MGRKRKITALLVADYFIDRASKAKGEQKNLSNKKLQKLIYYAQVWNLVFNDEKLFEDKIEAWVHGPVVFDVYKKYKEYGFDSIAQKIKKEKIKNVTSCFKEEQLDVLDNVFKSYAVKGANFLECLSHSEEPWQKAREGLEAYELSREVIDLELAKKFYKGLLNKSKY